MEFHGYGLVVGTAIVVGSWWAEKQVAGKGLDKKKFSQVARWAVLAGLVGARGYHVIDYWDYYRLDPVKILELWRGGLAIWGAVAGGLVGIWVGAGLSWRRALGWMDAAAMAMPLSQAIGRLGNWVNGELYGRNGLPLFLVEMILNLGLFWLMNFWLKLKHLGQSLGFYLVGYGVIRILLEPLRIKSWEWVGIPVASWFAAGAIIIGGGLIWGRKWTRN